MCNECDMSWNHRVVRREYPSGEVMYQIHEVYYNQARKADSCTQEPVSLMAEDLEDLRWTLQKMLACIDRPTLDYDKDFPTREQQESEITAEEMAED
jgi:hypothetical protein